MRILIVSEDIPQPTMGGLARHVLTLCRALVQAGHQVDLLGNRLHPAETAGPELEFGGRFFGELDGHFIGWKEPQLGMFIPSRRTWVARRFARVIMRHASDYDVIHYHGHFPNLAKFIPSGVNFVQTRHDQGSDCLLDTRFRNGAICEETAPESCAHCRSAHPNVLQRFFSTAAVKRFRSEVASGFMRHKTIFVSDMLLRNFARTCGNRKWGVTVHNFVDMASIARARSSAAQAVRTDTTQIVVAAKLWPAKGVSPFVREFAKQCRPGMHLTVIGDGPELPALRAEFESEHIRFAGWCSADETLKMVASANAIAVPSVWEEPCATTILEALLLGKTTFALAAGGTPELAIYAASPRQLRLYRTMQDLVKDLVTSDLHVDYPPPGNGLGGAEHAARQLLHIYAMPPGRLPENQERT